MPLAARDRYLDTPYARVFDLNHAFPTGARWIAANIQAARTFAPIQSGWPRLRMIDHTRKARTCKKVGRYCFNLVFYFEYDSKAQKVA